MRLPSGVILSNLIDDLRILSWDVADILLFYSERIEQEGVRQDFIKSKKKEDPVTLADLKVNEIIIERLNQKYKKINWQILSEENTKLTSNKCDTNADWVWIIDPLDGTKDFIQGTGNYAMHLALNYKKTPFLGIVLIPEKDELWISNGNNTWCERRDGSKVKLEISKKTNLKDMILVTSKNHTNQKLRDLISTIKFQKIKVMGSIGCKIASILRGESDIYISLSLPNKSSPKDWDFAAPEAILRAAGGEITNLDNKKLLYGKSNYEHGGTLIATNSKENHKKICLEIKEIINKLEIC